jgi:hypothetical protein
MAPNSEICGVTVNTNPSVMVDGVLVVVCMGAPTEEGVIVVVVVKKVRSVPTRTMAD